MKKIVILTWLHNGNYGSILQGFALQRYLRNEYYDVQNIDLRPSMIEKLKNCFKQRNPFFLLINEKISAYIANKSCSDIESLRRRENKFNAFLINKFNLTRTYHQFSELSEVNNAYDAYVCGSDQIWSPMLLSPSYYFNFLSDDAKKISYACSFGMSKIPISKRTRIKKMLMRYDAISVREDIGLNIVESLTHKNAVITVDPTMLLSATDWDAILCDRPLYNKPYMFCYFLSYNSEYWQKAVDIAKQNGLQMIVVPTTKESYKLGDIQICDAGPEDWVNLVKNASIVVTDSFHGCVFSIIYKRQFCVFKRFSDKNSVSQNSRVYTLLSAYKLEKCLVDNVSQFQPTEILEEEYNDVLTLVKERSTQSMEWLKNAIEA